MNQFSGAPNENIVQNHLNIELLNVFKSAGQEKSTKILISWQELKNQFLSLLVHR